VSAEPLAIAYVAQHITDPVSQTKFLDPRVHELMDGCGVVLSDVLGGKDVVEGRDGQTNERTCQIVIGRIRVKMELHV
jgi:hypothetical protein